LTLLNYPVSRDASNRDKANYMFL